MPIHRAMAVVIFVLFVLCHIGSTTGQLPLQRTSRGGLWKVAGLTHDDGNMYTAFQACTRAIGMNVRSLEKMGAVRGTFKAEERNATTSTPGVTGRPAAYMFRTDDDIFIVVRGTATAGDALNNLLFETRAYKYGAGGKATQNGQVHSGFLNQAEAIWPAVKGYLDKNGAASRAVWLMGHSLGGATVTLTALRIQQEYRNVGGVYTFGSPNVAPTKSTFFNAYWAANLTAKTFAVSNARELVVTLPPGWANPGNQITLCPSVIRASGPRRFATAGPACNELAGAQQAIFALHDLDFYGMSLYRVLPTTGDAGATKAWYKKNSLVVYSTGCMKESHCTNGCGDTSSSKNCGPNFTCYYGNAVSPYQCLPRLSYGTPCFQSRECKRGLKCGPIGGKEGPGLCSECLNDSHCPRTKPICDSNVVGIPLLPGRCISKGKIRDGLKCDRDDDCASGVCSGFLIKICGPSLLG